jgi:hypothetical protein
MQNALNQNEKLCSYRILTEIQTVLHIVQNAVNSITGVIPIIVHP